MAHAEHFLSRLVRLADDEVKLALSLYHDAEWVRAVVRTATLPDEAARVALSLSWNDGITDGASLARTFNLAAAASELSAERFYLPRVALDSLRDPWVPDHTWKMLDPMTRAASGRQPARREEAKPGRNTLCVCGSGKKYKRCCGT